MMFNHHDHSHNHTHNHNHNRNHNHNHNHNRNHNHNHNHNPIIVPNLGKCSFRVVTVAVDLPSMVMTDDSVDNRRRANGAELLRRSESERAIRIHLIERRAFMRMQSTLDPHWQRSLAFAR
jgi:ABC-type Zn2+ transport system substrate-binding protein/surface adhesin